MKTHRILLLLIMTGLLLLVDACRFSYEDNMIFVQGGTFQMGSNNGDSDEEPVHGVTVGDFYIGKTEVTVGEFKKFIDATSYSTDAEKNGYSWIYDGEWKKKDGVSWRDGTKGSMRYESDYDHPVIHVSWNDAVAYCEWLSEAEGSTFRLPTEAEWEYAAIGGSRSQGYKYSGSNDIHDAAWQSGDDWGSLSSTKPVGTKKANELGIYDMSGNVWEWCSDWYDSNYYKNTPSNNPTGPNSGSSRVLRGGSWYDRSKFCRVADRSRNYPVGRNSGGGFRVVLLP